MAAFTTLQATTGDIPLIIGVQKSTWFVTYGNILSREQMDYMFEEMYSPEALTQQMEREGHVFYLLQQGDVTIGFASFSKLEPSGDFKLHKLYVNPNAQQTGSGRFLISSIEEKVRQAGGKRILLQVNRQNKARHFYEKMGYDISRELDVAIGPYWMNDYEMTKEI